MRGVSPVETQTASGSNPSINFPALWSLFIAFKVSRAGLCAMLKSPHLNFLMNYNVT